MPLRRVEEDSYYAPQNYTQPEQQQQQRSPAQIEALQKAQYARQQQLQQQQQQLQRNQATPSDEQTLLQQMIHQDHQQQSIPQTTQNKMYSEEQIRDYLESVQQKRRAYQQAQEQAKQRQMMLIQQQQRDEETKKQLENNPRNYFTEFGSKSIDPFKIGYLQDARPAKDMRTQMNRVIGNPQHSSQSAENFFDHLF